MNGHSGNGGGGEEVARPRTPAVVSHELWDGRPDAIAAAIDPEYDHASSSENFPWTGSRRRLVRWPIPEDDEDTVWEAAVEEIRARLEDWPT